MANLKVFAIANLLLIWMTGAPQIESFEKQALSSVQAMPASGLDSQLPSRSFGSWLQQVIGANAGMVWQLTECSGQITPRPAGGDDLPACAEITASLPDGRRVFVSISVGTFKKGLNGKPAFFGAVVEQNDHLHRVRQLCELPEVLRATDIISESENAPATKTKNRIANLPAIKAYPVRIIPPSLYLPSPLSNVPGAIGQAETPPAPTPPPSPQELERVSEDVLQSRAINKAKPVYPPSARQMNATGAVEVEITISEKGLVVEAVAVSGHFSLRRSAVEAARKWVFKPAIFNGAPVKIKGVLTFVFAPGAK